MKGDDLSERLLDFAVRILRLTDALPKTPVGRHVSGQVVRSGTSAGAHYEEARGAESKADFIHKLGICWKETRESWYWIRLIHRAQLLKPRLVEQLLQEADELSAILGKSLATARGRKEGRPLDRSSAAMKNEERGMKNEE
jgi:four helix bundle protein